MTEQDVQHQRLEAIAELALARWHVSVEKLGLEGAAENGDLDALFEALSCEEWDQVGIEHKHKGPDLKQH